MLPSSFSCLVRKSERKREREKANTFWWFSFWRALVSCRLEPTTLNGTIKCVCKCQLAAGSVHTTLCHMLPYSCIAAYGSWWFGVIAFESFLRFEESDSNDSQIYSWGSVTETRLRVRGFEWFRMISNEFEWIPMRSNVLVFALEKSFFTVRIGSFCKLQIVTS